MRSLRSIVVALALSVGIGVATPAAAAGPHAVIGSIAAYVYVWKEAYKLGELISRQWN